MFGIYDPQGDCAQTTYYGLVALQHRGQEGAGIAVNNNRDIIHYKDLGLVNEIFDEKRLASMPGTMAIGHVRYASQGTSFRENVQPLVLRYAKGNLAVAHDGRITNIDALKKELIQEGAIFQTSSDTEVISYIISKERISSKSIEEAVQKSMDKLEGSYTLLVMSPKKLIAARDKWGFKPLCMGKVGEEGICFASESCAFNSIDGEFIRDINPGEVVVVEDGEIRTLNATPAEKKSLCIFEHIYFARPDSTIDNEVVHEARKRAGMLLAQQKSVDADVVIGVPDSGLSAAEGYAQESKIPYVTGFIKNRYIGRTFIKPKQSVRELAVRMKLSALKSSVEGKSVVMVDDSIVRGTTCARIIKLLREAGAKEVHVKISSPMFTWPCFFGTDIPSRDVLIANKHTVEEIRDIIGADSLDFLSMENLHKIAPNSNVSFCEACFTGNYNVDVSHLL